MAVWLLPDIDVHPPWRMIGPQIWSRFAGTPNLTKLGPLSLFPVNPLRWNSSCSSKDSLATRAIPYLIILNDTNSCNFQSNRLLRYRDRSSPHNRHSIASSATTMFHNVSTTALSFGHSFVVFWRNCPRFWPPPVLCSSLTRNFLTKPTDFSFLFLYLNFTRMSDVGCFNVKMSKFTIKNVEKRRSMGKLIVRGAATGECRRWNRIAVELGTKTMAQRTWSTSDVPFSQKRFCTATRSRRNSRRPRISRFQPPQRLL